MMDFSMKPPFLVALCREQKQLIMESVVHKGIELETHIMKVYEIVIDMIVGGAVLLPFVS